MIPKTGARAHALLANLPLAVLWPASRKGLAKRAPLGLVALLALSGASFPIVQHARAPEPWLATVTLGLDGRTGAAAATTLDLALREIRTSRVLGKAVDLLGLDRDPEFSGSASTGLGVALEILSGEGNGPADARRRAIRHLENNIALDRKPGATEAHLLVRASEPDKAMRIAEAIATVYASGSELTASIPPVASAEALEKLEKAQARLAEFTGASGTEKLSAALVLKSRMDGLDRHISALQAPAQPAAGSLEKASLKDVLDGRIPLAEIDPTLDDLRQTYVNTHLSANALAASLGPKHPRLLAARAEADLARRTFADQFARARKQAARAGEERAAKLKSLKAARNDLAKQIAATGIDVERHAQLSTAVRDARQAYDASATAAATGREPVFEASVPRPIEQPAETSLGWRAALGALAGSALALTVAAWRRHDRRHAVKPTETVPKTAPVEPVLDDIPFAPLPDIATPPAAEPARMQKATEHPAANSLALQLAAIRARHRSLVPANAASEPDAEPQPPRASRLGLDKVSPEDLPLIDKLRQVAPRVFADPAEEAEIERLRQELAELRSRVLRRAQGAA
jgi:uncharacterized protein involved in exopolysaccharide biosynthesis